ncbi:Flp family type IVb pilin [Robertmurraya korlensis]|uniref:Flp family type IVb pilin n=1 Tax=Robertmurraya korlensis TaxID=519977 RepID=UPI00203ACE33|nr:Flp family type IVb pilin [Robertmurraya korlensis]MCM3602698.1 Flp family type IVb pilin [Robertmurraya korlensis]
MMNKLAAKVAVKMMGLKKDEKGQGMAEYGLILVGVAVVAAGTFVLLGDEIVDLLESIIGDLTV